MENVSQIWRILAGMICIYFLQMFYGYISTIASVSAFMCISLCVVFQIPCRKSPGGTSGSFWWTRRGKWYGSGERTSPWRAFGRRWRRWCEKSSWRNGWSYDGARQRALGVSPPARCGCFLLPGTGRSGLWSVTASVVGRHLTPESRRVKRSTCLSHKRHGGDWRRACWVVRVCVWVCWDHPVVNIDNRSEHSW